MDNKWVYHIIIYSGTLPQPKWMNVLLYYGAPQQNRVYQKASKQAKIECITLVSNPSSWIQTAGRAQQHF